MAHDHLDTEEQAAKRVAILVNVSSGSQDKTALRPIARAISDAGYTLCDSLETSGSPMAKLRSMASKEPNLAVVLGGDGTQSAALAELSCPVLPLPGGTLNWLSRALLGEGAWPDLLNAALKKPMISPLGAGRVVERASSKPQASNGNRKDAHLFFLVSQFGGPTLFAKSREAIRYGIYRRAWVAARKAWSRSFAYELHSSEIGQNETEAAFSAIVANTALGSDVHNDTEALEVAGFQVDNALSGANIGLRMIFDDWRRAPNVTLSSQPSLHIRSDHKVPALLDGEPKWLRPPLRVEAKKDAALIWGIG